ncbi:MAG: hypothetical protein MUF60_07915, partial [Vicinamibacterales bacterium]|nr:hypothetical protein [Vicinamibacterales bacterium]
MRRTAWLVLGFLLLPVRASMAQLPAQSFEQLRVLVAQGDTLLVTDETGREVTGRLTDLAAASLTLEVGGAPRTWAAADV